MSFLRKSAQLPRTLFFIRRSLSSYAPPENLSKKKSKSLSSIFSSQSSRSKSFDISQNAPRSPSRSKLNYNSQASNSQNRVRITSPLAARSAELRERARSAKERLADLELRRSMGRKWTPGDIYSPKDLGDWEQSQWLIRRRARNFDVFKMIGKDPREFYRNFTVLSEFVSDSGLLLSRNVTGLSPKNQKRLLKAIRRARGTGLMPTTHFHPQLLPRTVGGVLNRG